MYFTDYSLRQPEVLAGPLLSKNKEEIMPLKKFTLSLPSPAPALSLHALHKNPPGSQSAFPYFVSTLEHTIAAKTHHVQL